MTQETRVFQVDAAAAQSLLQRLREGLPGDAEWRNTPHARFAVKALGVVLTCYQSGKLVLQGRELDLFVARFFDATAKAVQSTSSSTVDADIPFVDATVGSDEAGKGDYFGPLVVAACFAEPSQLPRLREFGVSDSKLLQDERAHRLAGRIEAEFDHEIVLLEPPAYNEAHARVGNVNIMLAGLHARAIAALYQRHPQTRSVVIDRFAADDQVATALRERGVESVALTEVPRAERHPVVAAASILARAAFLSGLARCSEDCGTDLHKGAGDPVDVVAKRVFAIGGRELLGHVAKLHFKNTDKIGRAR